MLNLTVMCTRPSGSVAACFKQIMKVLSSYLKKCLPSSACESFQIHSASSGAFVLPFRFPRLRSTSILTVRVWSLSIAEEKLSLVRVSNTHLTLPTIYSV